MGLHIWSFADLALNQSVEESIFRYFYNFFCREPVLFGLWAATPTRVESTRLPRQVDDCLAMAGWEGKVAVGDTDGARRRDPLGFDADI